MHYGFARGTFGRHAASVSHLLAMLLALKCEPYQSQGKRLCCLLPCSLLPCCFPSQQALGCLQKPNGYGSLLEASCGGTRLVQLKDGQQRKFLEDGDTVKLSAYCQGKGYKVGFGECTAQVMSASQSQTG